MILVRWTSQETREDQILKHHQVVRTISRLWHHLPKNNIHWEACQILPKTCIRCWQDCSSRVTYIFIQVGLYLTGRHTEWNQRTELYSIHCNAVISWWKTRENVNTLLNWNSISHSAFLGANCIISTPLTLIQIVNTRCQIASLGRHQINKTKWKGGVVFDNTKSTNYTKAYYPLGYHFNKDLIKTE